MFKKKVHNPHSNYHNEWLNTARFKLAKKLLDRLY